MGTLKKETELGAGGPSFASTLWTRVLEAKDPSSPDRRGALEDLIRTYWKPLYFFVRRRGKDVETAKDLTQGFFTAFLERDFLRYVERGRGKFRTFLLTAFEHYLADEARRAKARKRGGGKAALPLDFAAVESEYAREAPAAAGPEDLYARRWALGVTGRALQALRREFEAKGRGREFEALQRFFAIGGRAPTGAELAAWLGVSEADAKVRLHRARRKYRQAIYREIRASTAGEDEAREELRELFSALSRSDFS